MSSSSEFNVTIAPGKTIKCKIEDGKLKAGKHKPMLRDRKARERKWKSLGLLSSPSQVNASREWENF